MILPTNYDALKPHERRDARLQYMKEQDLLCAHCGASLMDEPAQEARGFLLDESSFPPDFFKHPIHLHHDHTTGLTVGAVHAHCNGLLKRYFNDNY